MNFPTFSTALFLRIKACTYQENHIFTLQEDLHFEHFLFSSCLSWKPSWEPPYCMKNTESSSTELCVWLKGDTLYFSYFSMCLLWTRIVLFLLLPFGHFHYSLLDGTILHLKQHNHNHVKYFFFSFENKCTWSEESILVESVQMVREIFNYSFYIRLQMN